MRWRIVNDREIAFSETLEQEARRLLRKGSEDQDEIRATNDREIAWALDRLDRMRLSQYKRFKRVARGVYTLAR